MEKEPKITHCPICGDDFVDIYYEEQYHPVIPPDKPYEGLADAEGWYPVKSIEYDKAILMTFFLNIDELLFVSLE